MVLRYSNIFTVTDGITHEHVTVQVESKETLDGDQLVSIWTLEGEYDTQEEFKDACEYMLKILSGKAKGEPKIVTGISFMLPGISLLIDELNRALKSFKNTRS